MVLNGTKIKNVINNVPYRNRYGTYVRWMHFNKMHQNYKLI